MPGLCSYRVVKRRRVVAIIVALVLLGWIAFYFSHPKEPGYQGKILTEWLQKYEADLTVSGRGEYEKAIRAIGTNGIPRLLELVDAGDMPGAAGLQSVVVGVGWKNFHLFDASYKRRLATAGFEVLGPEASSATPRLIELVKMSRSTQTKTYALWGLVEIKSDKETLLPLLDQCLKDSDKVFAQFAAEQFFTLYPGEATKAGANKLIPYLNPATNAPISK